MEDVGIMKTLKLTFLLCVSIWAIPGHQENMIDIDSVYI